jgi:hypothetical protein
VSSQHKYGISSRQKTLTHTVKIYLQTLLQCFCVLCLVAACGTTNAAGGKNGPQLSLNSQTIFCPYRNLDPSNYLVLKTDQINYDSGAIRQMKDYVQKFLTNKTKVPDTLEWQAGTITGQTDQDRCFLQTTVVNTGDSPIQINGLQIKTTQPPVANQDSYRLVELCSLGAVNPFHCSPQKCTGCGAGGGGSFTCGAHILLTNDNTSFTDDASTCNNVFLNPGDSLLATINFQSQINFIYVISPAFSIETTNGNSLYTIAKPQKLTFVLPDQFTCYQLQNNLFVVIPVTQPDIWCL